ncbi:UNVERIFIED_ORG: response regulator transcription factor [Bacillus sp. AZ43]
MILRPTEIGGMAPTRAKAGQDLVTAVRTVAAGHGLLDPAATLRVIAAYATAPAPDPARAAALAGLTERETDVLSLVAAGLSNAEIAARLYLGEATVTTHVSRILLELGLRDRCRRSRSPTRAVWSRRAGSRTRPVGWGHRRPSSDVSGVREAP